MKKFFTIIIPVYKAEKYVEQCINSVLNQTFKDFEAIFVDDCGGDGSMKIVEEYAKKDSRIKTMYHETNKGPGGARNTALSVAEGEYIVCLDSDDWYELNCLEVLHHYILKTGTNSIIYDAYRFDESTQTRDSEPILKNREGYLKITPQNICDTSDYCFKAYKTSSLIENNIRWPECVTFEDGEFLFKYFTINPETYVLENCLYNYRKHVSSICANANSGNGKIEDVCKVVKNIRDFYIEKNLYDEYKCAVLKLLYMRINTCKRFSNNREKLVNALNDLIEYLDYPNKFDEPSPVIFSVIVPIYNVEPYIEQCIKSITSQTFTNMEILCVDDCGSDNSMKIVENLAKNDKRIKIIKHEKNKGLGAARNTALDAAIGEYIVCVDSDDWIRNDCLEKVYNDLKMSGNDTVWYHSKIWWEGINRYDDGIFFPEFCSWNKAYKRLFLKKHNIRWSEGILFEDIEFAFKVGIYAKEMNIIAEPLYLYRRRSDSIIGESNKDVNKAKDIFIVLENLYNYLKENNFVEEYKNKFLWAVYDDLHMFRGSPQIQRQLLPIIKSFLERIEFDKLSSK